jgi:hypothetical protein
MISMSPFSAVSSSGRDSGFSCDKKRHLMRRSSRSNRSVINGLSRRSRSRHKSSDMNESGVMVEELQSPFVSCTPTDLVTNSSITDLSSSFAIIDESMLFGCDSPKIKRNSPLHHPKNAKVSNFDLLWCCTIQ